MEMEMMKIAKYDEIYRPVCRLSVKGSSKCLFGDECPYRHEGPVMRDPMEAIYMDWPYEPSLVKPPNDKSIRILYVRELFGRIDKQDLRDVISAHGEIETIEMDPSKDYAVVTYTTRDGAEKAAKELSDKLVKGMRLMVSWSPKPELIQPPPQLIHPLQLIQPPPFLTTQFSNLKPEPSMLQMTKYDEIYMPVCRLSVEGSSKCLFGDECPYRHEGPAMRDPMKEIHMDWHYKPALVKPPNDKSIRILYVRELFGRIDEQDLRDVISAHGEIESIEMDPSKDCAVVTYTTRDGAEKAAKELSDKLVKGMRLMVSWYIPEPELIQPHPFLTTQFCNLKLEPNMPMELWAAHPHYIPQPEPSPQALKNSFEMSTEAGNKFQY